MPEILADTSCLISLAAVGRLDILHELYGQVTITSEVAEEYGEPLPEWVQVRDLGLDNTVRALSATIDRGEASIIALAMQLPGSRMILDDRKARRTADSLSLPYTGLVGVLIKAKSCGVIPLLVPVLDELKEANFRISESVVAEAQKLAGEPNRK